jgi:hypothetical protein
MTETAKELWDTIQLRVCGRVDRRVFLSGLIFSDLDSVPIVVSQYNILKCHYDESFSKQQRSTNFGLHLRDSPILPNGAPKPKRSPSIKQTISSIISRNNIIQERVGKDKRKIDRSYKYIYANTKFHHYWDPTWIKRRFMRNRNLFLVTDMVAICFDRSKSETLHNAIHKVRMFIGNPPFYKSAGL